MEADHAPSSMEGVVWAWTVIMVCDVWTMETCMLVFGGVTKSELLDGCGSVRHISVAAKMGDYKFWKQLWTLDFHSKMEVVHTGRSMLELKDLLQKAEKRKNIITCFQMEWYIRSNWLADYATRNCPYCFPCHSFTTRENVWTSKEFCYMRNLPRSLSIHETSATHIQSEVALKTFWSTKLYLALNKQQRLNTSIHNTRQGKTESFQNTSLMHLASTSSQ